MNPAKIHRTSVVLVQHWRRGDRAGVWSVLSGLEGSDMAAVVSSMIGLVSAALDAQPADPEAWLNAAALHLAYTEGDVPPAA